MCATRSWKEQRLDRYMTDYLLRTGRLSAAASYAKERNLEVCAPIWPQTRLHSEHIMLIAFPSQDQVDIALFQECAKIGSALADNHSCSEALAWCGENRGTLKKTKVGFLPFPSSRSEL